MSPKNTVILTIVAALIISIGFYFSSFKRINDPSNDAWREVVQYNCEQSGGTFKNDICSCPFEAQLGQTAEMMYDKTTGHCQTTAGGPGGELGEQMDAHIGCTIALSNCKK